LVVVVVVAVEALVPLVAQVVVVTAPLERKLLTALMAVPTKVVGVVPRTQAIREAVLVVLV
jgi:hypothetical protein